MEEYTPTLHDMKSTQSEIGVNKEEENGINEIPQHHKAIWAEISKPENRGRTYHLSRCCVTILDSRKNVPKNDEPSSDKELFSHPSNDTKPLVAYLGKRTDWSETKLTEVLTEIEKEENNIMQASYNLSHQYGVLKKSLRIAEKDISDLKSKLDKLEENFEREKIANCKLHCESSKHLNETMKSLESLQSSHNQLKKSMIGISNMKTTLCEACIGRLRTLPYLGSL